MQKTLLPLRRGFFGNLHAVRRTVGLHFDEAKKFLAEGRRQALEQLFELMPEGLKRELIRVPFGGEELTKMCATAVLGVRGMNVAALCMTAQQRCGIWPITVPSQADFWEEVIRNRMSPTWGLFQEPQLMLRNSMKRDPRVEPLGLIEFLPDCATLVAFFLAESLVHGRDGWDLSALCQTSSVTADGRRILVGPSASSPVGVRIEFAPQDADLSAYAVPLAWEPRRH